MRQKFDRNAPPVFNPDLVRGWAVIPFLLMPHFWIDKSDQYRGYQIMDAYDKYYVSLCGKAKAGTNKGSIPTDPAGRGRCRLCENILKAGFKKV